MNKNSAELPCKDKKIRVAIPYPGFVRRNPRNYELE